MTSDEQRIAEIRETVSGEGPLASPGDDIRWLLDKLSERDAEIAELTAKAEGAFCVWCGHLGKRTEIAEHIMECVDHPVRKLALDIAERDARIAKLEADFFCKCSHDVHAHWCGDGHTDCTKCSCEHFERKCSRRSSSRQVAHTSICCCDGCRCKGFQND